MKINFFSAKIIVLLPILTVPLILIPVRAKWKKITLADNTAIKYINSEPADEN